MNLQMVAIAIAIAIAAGCGPDDGPADASPAGMARAAEPGESDRVRNGQIGAVSRDRAGVREVFARRPDDTPFTELVAVERGADGQVNERILVPARAMLDRPAISPDGAWVAYVDGVTGLPSVWRVRFDGGDDPVQLTNVAVSPGRGGPPDGFVPPPSAPPVYDGELVRWTDGDGVQRAVRWR